MSIYDLPTTVEVGGIPYEIRTDYRCALDIFQLLEDPELTDREKKEEILEIFYFSPDWQEIPRQDLREAVEKCFWFLRGGDEPRAAKAPKLVDWEQDFHMIVAPVNKVYGGEIRGIPYDPETNTGGLHFWTFLGYYQDIGDCMFAHVVRIRDMKARRKRLEKQDQEFYRRNRDIIDIKTRFTSSEEEFLKAWGYGK